MRMPLQGELGADEALGLMNQLFWNAALIAAPVLTAILVVGVIISIFQVATQLQEMTLSYAALILMPCAAAKKYRLCLHPGRA